MDSLTGNKLIAEFMGKEEGYDEHDIWQTFQYHSSWDWLMPVVHKIYFSVDDKTREMEALSIFEIGLTTPLKEVWEAVIEYIVFDNKRIS